MAKTIAGGHLDITACWKRCSNKEKMVQLQSSTQQRTERGPGRERGQKEGKAAF